ncbi:MAG: hypothetical protein O2819_06915 [Planctomycetota bacterium]|nr:hypothetical protein [Planctomycetota bacterium]MDA1105187.1 hypothetical protein [Planctomycetota bacterium]
MDCCAIAIAVIHLALPPDTVPAGGHALADAAAHMASDWIRAWQSEDRETLAARKRSADWHVGCLLELDAWSRTIQPDRVRTLWFSTWSAMGPADDMPVRLHWVSQWDGQGTIARVRWSAPQDPADHLDFPILPTGLTLQLDDGVFTVLAAAGADPGELPPPRDCMGESMSPHRPASDAYDPFDAATAWHRQRRDAASSAAICRADWFPAPPADAAHGEHSHSRPGARAWLVPPRAEVIESPWTLVRSAGAGQAGSTSRLQPVRGRGAIQITRSPQLAIWTHGDDGVPTRAWLADLGQIRLAAQYSMDAIQWDTLCVEAPDPSAIQSSALPIEAHIAAHPDGGRAARTVLRQLRDRPRPLSPSATVSRATTTPALDDSAWVEADAAEAELGDLEEGGFEDSITIDTLVERSRVLHAEAAFWYRIGGREKAREAIARLRQCWAPPERGAPRVREPVEPLAQDPGLQQVATPGRSALRHAAEPEPPPQSTP